MPSLPCGLDFFNFYHIGCPKRCNHFENNEIYNFNSSYRKEKYVAEIGAAFLNNHCGILNDDTPTDSSAYIQAWLNKLRNDKKFIVETAAKAQKACDYTLERGNECFFIPLSN